jgi:tetratricopeptide (TPR) repeat protein
MRRLLLSIILGAATLAVPTLARADDPNTAEAEALFDEGVKLMRAKDYEHARVRFQAATNLGIDAPNIWWNLAFAEYKSGHWVDALRHARRYMRTGDNDKKHVADFNRDLLPGTVKHVGQLTIDTAPDALVVIDGEDEVGRAPLVDPVAVAPGKHHVEARRDKDTVSADIDIAAGTTQPVPLIFKAPPPAPPPEVTSTYLDRAPLAPTGAPPTSEHPAMNSNPAHLWVPVGALAVGAVLLGVGGYLVTQSNSDANNAAAFRNSVSPTACRNVNAPGCGSYEQSLQSANRNETLSWVFYGTGAAFVAGAVVSWFVIPREVSGTRSVAEPLVGPGVVGARWTTTF